MIKLQQFSKLIQKNDIIEFIGNKHFTGSNSDNFKTCKPGIAKVDMIELSNKNPYHLIAEPFGDSDVYGWVKKEDIKILDHDSQIELAIDKLAKLDILNSPDYWKNFVKLKEVNGLDYLFIKSAKVIDHFIKRSDSIQEGLSNLITAGVVSLPEYWNQIAINYTNIGFLIQALGGSVSGKLELDYQSENKKDSSNKEWKLRNKVVSIAQSYLGYNEWDGSHMEIVDTYNSVKPLPIGYFLQSWDSWCCAFVSFVAIKAGIADTLIPRECGCERQINLFKEMGRFQEDENYMPKPGDIIYYNWDDSAYNYEYTDNRMFADHVGLIHSTGETNPDLQEDEILVIEGNKNDCVEYRTIIKNGRFIRGYGLPDYANFNG